MIQQYEFDIGYIEVPKTFVNDKEISLLSEFDLTVDIYNTIADVHNEVCGDSGVEQTVEISWSLAKQGWLECNNFSCISNNSLRYTWTVLSLLSWYDLKIFLS